MRKFCHGHSRIHLSKKKEAWFESSTPTIINPNFIKNIYLIKAKNYSNNFLHKIICICICIIIHF